MNFNISFDKYLNTLKKISMLGDKYARYKRYADEKREALDAEQQWLRLSRQITAKAAEVKRACDDAYNRIVKLLDKKVEHPTAQAPDLVDVKQIEDTLRLFNNLAKKIENSGGTEEEPIRSFQTAYRTLCSFFEQCDKNQFSYQGLEQTIITGRETAVSNIESALVERRNMLRAELGMEKEDLSAHQKLLAEENSFFKKGFRFPEKLADGIKLGTAMIEIENHEAEVLSQIYPELGVKANALSVPYIFPINSKELSSKANIFIEVDDTQKGVDAKEIYGQLSAIVRQMSLKILSECPLGMLSFHFADLTDAGFGRFPWTIANLETAIGEIKDKDVAQLLSDNLVSEIVVSAGQVQQMASDEFRAVRENQDVCIKHADPHRHLYVYFGLLRDINVSACRQIVKNFQYGDGGATVGVHNIVVVAKSEMEQARAAVNGADGSNKELADAWLQMIGGVKKNSDCFVYTGKGLSILEGAGAGRSVYVRLGETYFENVNRYNAEEEKVISTLQQCNVEQGSPFIDLEGDGVFTKDDVAFGEYVDDSKEIRLRGDENIAVIFGDESFSDDEKARVMSSVTLGVLSAYKPGMMRLALAGDQRNARVMGVTNGLKGVSDGIRYSLMEDNSWSAQDRLKNWGSEIENISKTLVDKRRAHNNRGYNIYNLIEEDSNKYLRVVYDEYSDDNKQQSGQPFCEALIPTIQRAKQNGCGLQCVLAIETKNPHKWEKTFEGAGVFDYVIVARNHGFMDSKGRRLKLSVLTDKDDAQVAASNMLESYIEAAVSSPRYEEIGFGTQYTPNDQIGTAIQIPVGRKDGLPFSMGFDSAGIGLIGYMVQGTSGSGKSSLLFSMIYNGAMKYAPDALQFYLLDFKDGTSFDVFRKSKYPLPHVKQLSVKNDMEDAAAIFSNLEDEIAVRSASFKQNNVREISAYNQGVLNGTIHGPHMPRIVVVIDECQNAFYTIDSTGTRLPNELLVNTFSSMTRVCRSYGIHFVVATQRMEEGLARRIGSEMKGRCSFKMLNEDDAAALLDRSVAQKINALPRYGAMLFSDDGGKSAEQVQVAFDYRDFQKYSDRICAHYGTKEGTFEIGNEDALTVSADQLPKGHTVHTKLTDAVCLPLAQNCMRDSTVELVLKQQQNHAIFMVGENQRLASNIMTSLLYSVSHLEGRNGKAILHANAKNAPSVALAHDVVGSRVQIATDEVVVLEDVYFEMLDRQEQVKKAAVGEEISFDPWIVAFDNVRADLFNTPQDMPRQSAQNAPSKVSFNMLSGMKPKRTLPAREKVWKAILSGASEVGIYVCLYVADARSLERRNEYFNMIKHMITFPCQSLAASFTSTGAALPMSATLGSKHIAFNAKQSTDAPVCYYVTDSVLEGANPEFQKSGASVYKIKPYIFD